eukprot:IDg7163t1
MAPHSEPPVLPVVERKPSIWKEDAGPETTTRAFQCGKLLSKHTAEEAALSYYAPTWLLVLTRLASGGGLLSFAILTSTKGARTLVRVDELNLYLMSVGFILLALCSMLSMFGSKSDALPSLAVPLYQMSATFSLFLAPVGLIMLAVSKQFTAVSILRLLPPLALFVIDTVFMQSMLRFRHRHVWMSFTVFVIDVVVWIRLSPVRVNMSNASAAVGAPVALLVWLFLSSVIVTA